jgi:hypothetical protein
MKATGTEISSPACRVAMRRPGWTAAFTSPIRPLRFGHGEGQAPERGGPVARRLRRPDQLEDDLAEAEEALGAAPPRLAGAPRQDAPVLQGRSGALQVRGGHDEVVDRQHAVGVVRRAGRERFEVGRGSGQAVDVAAGVRERPAGDAPAARRTGEAQPHRADPGGAVVADREPHRSPRCGLVAHADLDERRCRGAHASGR